MGRAAAADTGLEASRAKDLGTWRGWEVRPLKRAVNQADAPGTVVALPSGLHIPRLELPAGRIAPRQITAHLALAALFAGCAAIVIFASSGPTGLVWHSEIAFPGWVAGPLHGLVPRLPHHVATLSFGFLCVMVAMLIAYGVALLQAKALCMRSIWVFVVAAAAVLLLGPPLQASDVFNYLGYDRLWALSRVQPVHAREQRGGWRPDMAAR